MTFSIIALCPRTGQLGVAAATGMPGVGKLLTHAAPHTGAIATQGAVNPYLGIDGLALLNGGMTPADALRVLLDRDPGRDGRQLAIIDGAGRIAQWTGSGCDAWAGERRGEGFAVQGNLLAGPDPLDACARAMVTERDQPFHERLLRALEAGERAGGDRRGSRSATVYIMAEEEYPLWDARVDDHDRPLTELRRLMRRFEEDFVPQIHAMAKRDGDRYRTE